MRENAAMLKLVLSSIVLSAAPAALAQAQADEVQPPDARFTVTERSEADGDFAFQGEYEGTLYTPHTGREAAGLQVAALGGGQFLAVQYRGGLPGAGWNRSDKIELVGTRTGDVLVLEAGGYSLTVQDNIAMARNSTGRRLGHLAKTHRVSPTMGLGPPADAIVLFDGTSTDEFDKGEILPDGSLLTGVVTRRSFGDFRLHIEFRTPYMPYAKGQGRGNAGVYIQQRYEVQILDSFALEGAYNECGALYRTKAPEVNMCLPPLAWQTYDVYFTQPRWDAGGKKTANARITVMHNGVAVQDDFELPNKTGAGRPEGPEPGPIRLQWHGNPVRLRNIWLVPSDPVPADAESIDACEPATSPSRLPSILRP